MLESAQGNNAVAFDLLTKARQIDPDSSKVLADLVVLAMRAGKPNAAADAAKSFFLASPRTPNTNISPAPHRCKVAS